MNIHGYCSTKIMDSVDDLGNVIFVIVSHGLGYFKLNPLNRRLDLSYNLLIAFKVLRIQDTVFRDIY